MRELIVNRTQPEVDPVLHAWRWEIPVDLFFAAVVAGMMILSGIALLRSQRGATGGLRAHGPLLAFGLVHICLLALFLDLSHKLYVWNLYLTLQPKAPMSWGSWILTLAYVVLAATAVAQLPTHWPWLGERLPVLARLAARLSSAGRLRLLGGLNLVLGTALVIYTGVLLATMVARPLWNTMVLPALFLASGLAGGAAMLALAARFVPVRAVAPPGPVSGLVNALVVAVPGQTRSANDAESFTRLALVFLVAQAVALFLFAIGLATGSASQIEALKLVLSGHFALSFWGLVVSVGLLAPLVLLGASQMSTAGRRRALAPAGLVLLLVGGLALRWVLVDAGQASRLLSLTGLAP